MMAFELPVYATLVFNRFHLHFSAALTVQTSFSIAVVLIFQAKSDTGLTNSIPFYSLQKHPIPTFLQDSPARAASFGAMGSPTLARPATTSAWMLFAP